MAGKMKQPLANLPEGPVFAKSRAEVLTVVVLLALLAFMPFALGTVEAWSELIAVIGATALWCLFAWRFLFEPDFKRPPFAFSLLIFVFCLFVLTQIVPLPAAILEVVSPNTLQKRASLLADLESSTGYATISFYPLATAEGLRNLFVGTAIFVAVSTIFVTRRQIKFLFTAVLLIGTSQAILALAQVTLDAPGIYWSQWIGQGTTFTGSFLNHSNYCQYMNLVIGCGVALFLITLEENKRSPSHSVFTKSQSFKLLLQRQGWMLACLSLCIISIMFSLSRNGLLSLLVATTLIAICLLHTQALDWRGWILFCIPLVVFFSLSIFGMDLVYNRIAKLQDVDYLRGRWNLARDVLSVWQDFPLMGVGLDAHEVVFPAYDTLEMPTLAEQADNDYAQLLEEMGVLGAGLILAAICLLMFEAWRLMRHGVMTASVAVYGLSLGLLAVAIHSTTDFGQRLPAVFGMTAVCVAILLRLAANEHSIAPKKFAKDLPASYRNPRHRKFMGVAVAGLLMIACGWSLNHAYAAFIAERWWADALHYERRLDASDWQADDETFIELVGSAEEAHAWQPQNPLYAYWLNVYRWQFFSRRLELITPDDPNIRNLVGAIADSLSLLRQTCPTYGPAYSLEGQLRKNVMNDDRGITLVRLGASLSPYDGQSNLVAGELEAHLHHADEAWPYLRRAVTLEPSLFESAVAVCLIPLNRIDWAESLADNQHGRLIKLANLCSEIPQFKTDAAQIVRKAEQSLEDSVQSATASPQETAQLAYAKYQSGQLNTAITYYRQALNSQYHRVDWRLGLARALADSGDYNAAIHETKVCLRLSPQFQPAQQLLESLAVHGTP